MTPGPGLLRTLLPKGFLTSGVNCGVRRYRPDLGVIISEVPSAAAGVFTLNQCKAAPVLYSQGLLPSENVRAILTNSGQANAATGEQGVVNNLTMVTAAARALNMNPNQILVASTGVIGAQLEIDKITAAMPELSDRVTDVAENFALAILTTDLVPKTVSSLVKLSTGSVRITGICKGSGMIHPNMATMLGYLLTDAKISGADCQTFLTEANSLSFNMISVDGDTSTNDCVFMMANGQSGVCLETEADKNAFKKELIKISQFLAQSIAADGEGASKLIEVQLKGAPTLELARQAARAVTTSPLVKTAMHGEDPNWGRILAKLGSADVGPESLGKMDLSFQGHSLFENGAPLNFDRSLVRGSLKQPKIKVLIDLKSGKHSATAWGCDLSKKYVDINTEYS